MDKIVVWIVMIAVAMFGAVGNILLKLGTNQLGEISPQRLLDVSFALRYLFMPSIFGALILFFLGRFLMGSPISALGVTQAVVIITVLGLIFTLILEALVFHQRYDFWTYVGIVIGIASVGLIARGISN